MPLVLAVHNLNDPVASAKVPFSMVILLDCVAKKLHPPELKARQILPTSGLRSVSLWEAPSPESLQTWLDELLDEDCSSEVFEVQEQFAVGLFSDLAAARAAEQLSATTKSTAAAASQQIDRFDEKFKVSEQASAVLKTVSENTRTAVTNLNTFTKNISSKAMENEKVANTATATAQAFRGLGDRLKTGTSSLTTSFKGLGLWTPNNASGGSPKAQQTAEPRTEGPPVGRSAAASTAGASPTTSTSILTTIKEPTASSSPAAAEPVPAVSDALVVPTAAAAPSPPEKQADIFSLGDEDDVEATQEAPALPKEEGKPSRHDRSLNHRSL